MELRVTKQENAIELQVKLIITEETEAVEHTKVMLTHVSASSIHNNTSS